MLIKSLLKFITGILLISVISLCCESCENNFGNFQGILLKKQQPGRFQPNAGMKLFGQMVFTKMACLDICLRTAERGSFDVKQKYSKNARKTFWICVINRRVNSQGTRPRSGQHSGWIHFSLSSHDLQKVSYFR